MTSRRKKISGSQTLAVVLVSLPCALSLTLVAALFSPGDAAERIFGSGLLLPLIWTALTLAAFLLPNARRTWLILGIATGLASSLVALRFTGAL